MATALKYPAELQYVAHRGVANNSLKEILITSECVASWMKLKGTLVSLHLEHSWPIITVNI
jgi:hypothetical protein